MVGLLQTGVDGFAIEGAGSIHVAREESVEQVDHVAVVGACHQVLRIAASGAFETQVVVDVVFGSKAGLQREGHVGVFLQTQAGLQQEIAHHELVFGKGTDFRAVSVVFDRDVVTVGLEVRGGTCDLDAELQGVFPKEVVEVEPHADVADLAEAVRVVQLLHLSVVLGIGEVTLDHHRGFAGDDDEVGTCTPRIPAEVGQRLVVVYLVVEGETEDVHLGTVRRIERDLGIDVGIVERQSRLGSVVVQHLAGLLQIGVLGRQHVGDRGIVGTFGLLERAFHREFCTEAVGTDFSCPAFLVAVTCGDVHHRRDAASIFRSETARIDLGIANDVRVEDGEQADGVEGVEDGHAVEQHLVLDGGTATDVELSTLVASKDDTRHHLKVLRQVALSADARDLVDGLRGDGDHRSLRFGARLHLFGGHANRFQGLAGFFQHELLVDALPFGNGDLFLYIDIAHAGDA